MGIGKAKGSGAIGAKSRSRHDRSDRGFTIQWNILFTCLCAPLHTVGGNTFEALNTVNELLEVGYSPH